MTEHSTLEERLARSLETQASGFTDAPFGLADVKGRARSIRTRRRGVAAGVAAAVVAVALPVALLAGQGSERSRGVDPAPEPVTSGAPVLHGRTLTLPDGRTVATSGLPVGVGQVGVLDDGRIVAPVNGGGGVIRVLTPEGRFVEDYPVLSTALTMGADGATVAWVDRSHRIQVLESGADDPVAFPGVPMPGEAEGHLAAVFGSDCAAGGCTVLADDQAGTAYEITLDGATEVPTPEPFSTITDVSPDAGLWAVQIPDDQDPQYGCAGLYDPVAAEIVARSCETAGLRFSPDGAHVLGMFTENNMAGAAEVLDLSLRPVLRYDPEPDVIGAGSWDDAGSLLIALASHDGVWSLVRVPIEGGPTEVVEGPVPGINPETGDEYLFSE
jgi:hypothetical protein